MKVIKVGDLLVNADQILYIAPILERKWWEYESRYVVVIMMVGREPVRIPCSDKDELNIHMNNLNLMLKQYGRREETGEGAN